MKTNPCPGIPSAPLLRVARAAAVAMVVAIVASLTSSTHAGITYDYDYQPKPLDAYSPWAVPATDLLQTDLAAATYSPAFPPNSPWTDDNCSLPTILNDGVFQMDDGTIGGTGNLHPHLSKVVSNAWIQYDLDTTTNPAGYDITSIVVYGGWENGGRDRVDVNVKYSLVGSPTIFVLLGHPQGSPNPGSNTSATRATVTPDTPLSGVKSIRFEFPAQENGWVGYGEFDVVGSATEVTASPTSTVLALTGGINPSMQGDSLTITATVTNLLPGPPPTGQVEFYDGVFLLDTVPLDGSGVAGITTSVLEPGSHGITAHYLGDVNNLASSSPVLGHMVNPSADIETFGQMIGGDHYPGMISGTMIDWIVPYGTDLTNLTPVYTMSSGAAGAPASGTARDFTVPVDYVVTGANGFKKTYTVSASKAPISTAKDILTFGLPDMPAVVSGSSITWTVLASMDVAALAPVYTVSPIATGSPSSGTTLDFTTPQTYTITAQDGSTMDYTVTVNQAAAIVSVDYASQLKPINDSAEFEPWPVNADDLLQTHLAAATYTPGPTADAWRGDNCGHPDILKDGVFKMDDGTIGGEGNLHPYLTRGTNGNAAQYDLDLTATPLGYDLSKIVTYGGWENAGRDCQLIHISYSTVSDPAAFVPLALIDTNPPNLPDNHVSAVRATVHTYLTGVAAVRFEFPNGQENDWAGYGEFDVVGTPVAGGGGFAGWIGTGGYGLTGAAAAVDFDYDGDSFDNGVEYVLGTDPTSPNGGGPVAAADGADFVFTFQRALASKTPDTTVVIDVGSNLVNWPGVYPVDTAPEVTITPGAPGYETVTLRVPRAPDTKKFARMRVTVTTP